MKAPIDNFSAGSGNYSLFRPSSPPELFDFLYANTNRFEHAWDCGTGNGQVAAVLAQRFERVTATDISQKQVDEAPRLANIDYLIERAEHTSIASASVDLVTVAQAIHWFDFEPFYAEVKRVCRPGALIAAWTYTGINITESVDKVIEQLYHELTGPYWDKERRYVDACYRSIPFPFEEIETPVFSIVRDLTLEQLSGYLRTWSGVKHYERATGVDPVSLVEHELVAAWGDVPTKESKWPVHMRAGRV
ncbi:MAG: class I SAM-dependent methyltransferase [Taibaiella sp.]|nr:class I SAM-dependent methyltransferase [Taibaiella sp.]